MNLLLDMYAALWAITDNDRLSTTACDVIAMTRTSIWVNVASLCEITINYALGRGITPTSSQVTMQYFFEFGCQLLLRIWTHIIKTRLTTS